MTAATRGGIVSLWILASGLATVGLEVENVRAGARIRDLLLERDASTERVRRLEMRYNRMVSPDVLEKELPPELSEEE
jgi:hypothetical protein